MPKQNIIATNFTSGEVSPLVRGRVDAQKYANGLETCENFIVRPQGPIWRRSGTKYLGPIKFKTGRAILVPFEYSDTKGYVLEVGRGYIHVWQGDGKLFETTASEIEKFKLETNADLYMVRSNLYEYDAGTGINKAILPAFGNISTTYSKYSGVGTATVSKSGTGKIRVTTSIPNTIRSGANIYLYFSGVEKTLTSFADNGSGAIRVTCTGHGFVDFTVVEITGQTGTANINGIWQIHNVTANTFDLVGTSYSGTFSGTIKARTVGLTGSLTATRISPYSFDVDILNPDIYAGANAVVYTTGLLSGDRVYISGAADVDDFGNRHVIVQQIVSSTTPNRDEFVTNINSPGGDKTPQNEEGWVIPIEILTDYGYLKSQPIKGITNNGSNLVRVEITNHGFSTGDTVNIYQTNSSADGDWEITVVNSNFFDLVSSTFYSTSTSGYGRKYLDSLSDELEKLRFVQSADVMYIMHPDHPVCKLTRLSNDGDRDDWLFAQVAFKDGPYLPLNNLAPKWDETTPANGSRFADVYFELSSYSHTATVKSETAFAADGVDLGTESDDASKYIEYRDGDQWRLAQLPSNLTASVTTATVTIIDNVLLHLDESTKFTNRTKDKLGRFRTYDAGSPNMTPSIPGAATQQKTDPNNYLYASNVAEDSKLTANFGNTFGTADVGKYVRYFHGATPAPYWSKIKKIESDKAGKECSISQNLTMASNNGSGKFVISNHSRTATLKSYKNGDAFSAFNTTDVNRIFRIGWAGRWTWGEITEFISASQVSVNLYEDVPRDPHNAANLAGAPNGALTASDTTGRSYDWRMGAWSETTGYPSCGVFHEQRLWLARTDAEPQTLWASVAGDFENFSPTELDSVVLEDNAIGFTIASTKANPIKWMAPGPAITVGTTGGEWQIKSSSISSEPITPLNIVVVPHTSHGSHKNVQPVRIGSSVLFADRPGNRIRELIYDFSVDALVSRDLTYLSEHMLRESNGAIYSAYQQEPNNICWYVLSDGTLAAVTINKDQEIVAWHHHTIADATVESIAVIPSTDSSKDNVYMVVKRGSNRYVELLQDDFYPNGSNLKGMRYLDGAVVFSGTDFSGTKIAGLHHLEGKTVTISIDGTILGTYTVNGGIVTIASQSGKELVVGLPYTSTAKSLPPEGGSAFGVSQGKIKKLTKYNVRLLNSLAMDYGFNSNGQSLNSLTNLHENGTSTDFYTGTKELIPNNPYDVESQWTLSTNKPYPLNVLSVTLTVETGE